MIVIIGVVLNAKAIRLMPTPAPIESVKMVCLVWLGSAVYGIFQAANIVTKYTKNKKVSYRKRTARQLSRHKKIGQRRAAWSTRKNYSVVYLISMQNLAAVCHIVGGHKNYGTGATPLGIGVIVDTPIST